MNLIFTGIKKSTKNTSLMTGVLHAFRSFISDIYFGRLLVFWHMLTIFWMLTAMLNSENEFIIGSFSDVSEINATVSTASKQ